MTDKLEVDNEHTVNTLEYVHQDVVKLLAADKSGHDIDHVERVYRLSMQLAKQEGANLEEVAYTAYLHDVDDYKLFGEEHAENLTNAKAILERYKVEPEMSRRVLLNISTMGYSKSLEGIRPESLAGKIVSDADMNDAIGAQGLIRICAYSISKGRPFFVRSIKPNTKALSAEAYKAGDDKHAVQHFFDKLLLLPGMMMTEAGRVEAGKRAEIMVDYLKELFREEDAKDWELYLDDFILRR